MEVAILLLGVLAIAEGAIIGILFADNYKHDGTILISKTEEDKPLWNIKLENVDLLKDGNIIKFEIKEDK